MIPEISTPLLVIAQEFFHDRPAKQAIRTNARLIQRILEQWAQRGPQPMVRRDVEAERRALGYLAGRFSFKTWASGETMVSEHALPALAAEGIRFSVEGPATYERLASLRDLPTAVV